MIDGSEKPNRQLAFELQNRMFVKSAVNEKKTKGAGEVHISQQKIT